MDTTAFPPTPRVDMGVDHMGVDHMGVDHMGVDHMGVDKTMG